jgi:hypothetical protein
MRNIREWLPVGHAGTGIVRLIRFPGVSITAGLYAVKPCRCNVISMAFKKNNMNTKKVLVSALLAAGIIGFMATPVSSIAQVEIQLNYGPPAPRYEVIPAPRNGYVWSGGHWQWRNNRHEWTAGNWQPTRPGYAYYQPRWVERDGGGGWHYRASRWDKDGDGVPNNKDRRPNDPTRR